MTGKIPFMKEKLELARKVLDENAVDPSDIWYLIINDPVRGTVVLSGDGTERVLGWEDDEGEVWEDVE
jgi:hypothetical protein